MKSVHIKLIFVCVRACLYIASNFHFYDTSTLFNSSLRYIYVSRSDSSRYIISMQPFKNVNEFVFSSLCKYCETGINCCQMTTIDNFTSATPFRMRVKRDVAYLIFCHTMKIKPILFFFWIENEMSKTQFDIFGFCFAVGAYILTTFFLANLKHVIRFVIQY